MKWIVKNVDGVLEFQDIVVCTDSQYNKINAGANQHKICKWCDDMHVKACTEHNGNQPLSVLKEVITEVDEREARRMDKLHADFLKLVDTLPNSVDPPAEQEEVSISDCMEAVKYILKQLDEGEVDGAAVTTTLGPITIPRGEISGSMLRELLETYVKAHEHEDK